MLRITRDDERASGETLSLEGRLVEPWATLLEQECAVLMRSGRGVAVDLSGVSVVDRRGIDALGRLRRVGVTLRGCSDLLASVLEAEGILVDRDATGADGAGGA